MEDLNTETWLLYVHAYMDQSIAPYSRNMLETLLVKSLLSEKKELDKLDDRKAKQSITKIRNIWHRISILGTSWDIFKNKGNPDCFEQFIVERMALEKSSNDRNEVFDQGFYGLVEKGISQHHCAAVKVNKQLFGKIQCTKEFESQWVDQTKVHLAHVWVETLCHRAKMRIKQIQKGG